MVCMQSTKNMWLTFGGHSCDLTQGFCYADYANQWDWHLIAGYAYLFGCGAVSRSSKKQQIVALLTIEAKYITQAHAAKERLWLWAFLSELQGKPGHQIMINSDNQGAIRTINITPRPNILMSSTTPYMTWLRMRSCWCNMYLWTKTQPTSLPKHCPNQNFTTLLNYLDPMQSHLQCVAYCEVLLAHKT